MKLTLEKQEELFAKDCKLINLRYEYNGYIGDEKWAIITELLEEELCEKYPDIICRYTPFVYLSIAHGEVINDFNKNEEKYKKREVRTLDNFGYDDGLTEHFHHELIWDYEDPLQVFEREKEESQKEQVRQTRIRKVRKALSMMKLIQRERLEKEVLKGMNSREIAEEEGVNYSSVDKSLRAARKNFKKFYENL